MAEHYPNFAPLTNGGGRDVIWRLLDGVGLEHCRLILTEHGPQLSGIVVTSDDGEPVTLEYSVLCDRFWHTRTARIGVTRASSDYSPELHLESDGDGHWWRIDGAERTPLPALNGCLDIDIAVTPSTNTLPLRRYDMVPGAKVHVTAAWVQFPTLEVTTLPQSYARLDEIRYRYESFRHEFVALLEVDELGLVQTYESLWERVAVADYEP